MTTDSQIAPESSPALSGARRRARLAPGSRWRLPIAYRAIASTALGVDLALILVSATCAEAAYHKIPDELSGEYSHTIAAAIFVAVLFVASMRVQKLYSPTRLMLWDDQARSVLGAWCGAFLILGFGRFQLGGEPRSFARRRSAVLGDRPRRPARAPDGVEDCAAARPGKRRLAGPDDRQPDLGRGRAVPVHRQFDPARLSCGGSFPRSSGRVARRRGHRQHHFDLPDLGCRRDHALCQSRTHVERPVGRPAAAGSSVARHVGALRNPRPICSCALATTSATQSQSSFSARRCRWLSRRSNAGSTS